MIRLNININKNNQSKDDDKSNRIIAYYADEILDVWLNIGKHEPDEKEPVLHWRSWDKVD